MSAFSWTPTPSAEVVRRLGVSEQAVALVRTSEVFDCHLESFIPTRLTGYDLRRRHSQRWLRGRFFGHLDIPRALDAGLTGAMWSIATNVARPPKNRFATFRKNVVHLARTLEDTDGHVRVVRNAREYREARAAGAHAAMICVQGGNAYEGGNNGPFSFASGLITRVTVIHLSDSCYGQSSSPVRFRLQKGLTHAGAAFIEALDEARIFVDLAHMDREAFWQTVDIHDAGLPLINTHTGLSGVNPHWRNIDDAQVRAIADTGGVVGVIFERDFLGTRRGQDGVARVMAHLEHLIQVGGEDSAALGSDYDGAIRPPSGLRDGFEAYYRLVDAMLNAGWSVVRIQKVLGNNFLRCFERLRP